MGGHVPSAWARGSPAARKPPPQAQGSRARAVPPCLSLEKRARVKAPVQELVPNGGQGEVLWVSLSVYHGPGTYRVGTHFM